MKRRLWLGWGFLLIISAIVGTAQAQTQVTVEGNMTWQSRNDQRIPGDSGTQFSISDFDPGPFAGYRVYVGHIWNNRHELRALYAPLAIEADGVFDEAVDFQGSTFAADTHTVAYYKFNSYRLTYAYHLASSGRWQTAVGFTAKVRDAEVRLEQPGLSAKKANVGFVPLINFQASYGLSDTWHLRFDLDALGARQGRAIDLGAFLERRVDPFALFLGYRTIEGGADNDRVYNFAWFHQAVFGTRYDF